MPYKSRQKRLAYLRKWRRLHPNYSRDYMRTYNDPPKTAIRRRRKLKYAPKEIEVSF